MTRLATTLVVVLGLAAIALGGTAWWQGLQAREAREQLDSLRSEVLVAAIDSAGWELRIAEATDDLARDLQEARDSSSWLSLENAELGRQVELLGGQLREMTAMYAGAVGQIEAHGVVHQEPDSPAPDSVTAEVDDGLLAGRLIYRPPAGLGIDPYSVRIPVTTGIVELPDGRWASVARSPHPRVTLEHVSSVVQPPDPVAYCSITERALYATGGLAVGLTVVSAADLITAVFREE